MEQWLQDGKSSDGLWSERSLIGSGFEGGREENIENQEPVSSTELDQLKRMKQVSSRVNIASLVDSQFERGFARASEVSNLEGLSKSTITMMNKTDIHLSLDIFPQIYEPDFYEPSLDEEIPVQFMQQFYKSKPNQNSTTLALNGREDEYAEALSELRFKSSDFKSKQEDSTSFDVKR